MGTMLTPLSRRRPWKVARETATLDHLSNGRLVLPVGLGALDDAGFGRVGEATDRKVRAELLDESLDIITGLWSGKPFSYVGKHYKVEEMTFLPAPVQQPRIPIWVVGAWPHMKSMRRVLRYDGLLPAKMDPDGSFAQVTPDDIRVVREFVERERPSTTPFDIIWEGETPGDNPGKAAAIVRPYAEAGATWWLRLDVDLYRWANQRAHAHQTRSAAYRLTQPEALRVPQDEAHHSCHSERSEESPSLPGG